MAGRDARDGALFFFCVRACGEQWAGGGEALPRMHAVVAWYDGAWGGRLGWTRKVILGGGWVRLCGMNYGGFGGEEEKRSRRRRRRKRCMQACAMYAGIPEFGVYSVCLTDAGKRQRAARRLFRTCS